MRQSRGFFLLLSMFLLARTAFAQDVAEFPVIKDLPPAATLPADGVWDIRGVTLGATVPETLAALKAINPSQEPEVKRGTLGLRDDRGNTIAFTYTTSMSQELNNPDGSREYYYVFFSTNALTERATKIERRVVYASPQSQGSFTELQAALLAKYGKETLKYKPYLNEIYYIWFDGKRTVLSRQQMESMRYQPGTPANCAGMFQDPGTYQLRQPRTPAHKGCTAGLKIIVQPGARDDLISQVTFIAFDNERDWQSSVATDTFLLGELDKKTRAKTGSAPKL